MRCEQCNKFASMELGDPEFNVDVNEQGMVSGDVRIVRNCVDCNTELKEATFDIEHDFSEEAKEHQGEGHELSLETEDEEATERGEGSGRYMKSFFGASCMLSLHCTCKEVGEQPYDTEIASAPWHDEIQASSMDEL